MKKTDYVKNWINQSEEDERLIEDIIEKSEVHADMISFHSQQMAEKLLKSLVAYAGENPPKVHDLVELETILSETYEGVEELHEDLEFLNDFYIESRYPDDFPEITSDEAESAYRKAKRVKSFVLDKMND